MVALFALLAGACGTKGNESALSASGPVTSTGDSTTSGGGTSGSNTGGSTATGMGGGSGGLDLTTSGGGDCKGLECQIPACPNNKDGTTISGITFAPNGTLPLYNVVVYVPKFVDKPLEPITTGAKCEQCATSIADTIATALSDPTGKFKLTNVPAGKGVPLVVQVGKWRRKVTLPNLVPCKDNPLSDPELTRLPRSQLEGDLPQMAVVTGGCDPFACLFRKMGLADDEFTDSSQKGRMHVYKGIGGANVDKGVSKTPETSLWDAQAHLSPYDVVLLSCECSEHDEVKTPEQKVFMHDYLDSGGRMFATHYHYTWFKNGPADFQNVAEWKSVLTSSPYSINTSFPKGVAFLAWLSKVATLTNGQINLTSVKDDVGTIKPQARAWIYKQPPDLSVKYFTFNTPLSAMPDKQCGRAVFSDIHVSEGSVGQVPSGCDNKALTDQEKALIFLFFDLAACITPDDKPPEPPNPK